MNLTNWIHLCHQHLGEPKHSSSILDAPQAPFTH